MKWPRRIRHEFIETVPKTLEEGVLYVSIEYASAVHNCFCGCGTKVVTPFTPADWKLTFDGDTISLWPSIGNWQYPCQSHYIIDRDVAHWAPPMSREQIESGRSADRARQAAYYREAPSPVGSAPAPVATASQPRKKRSLWDTLFGR